MVLNLKSEEGKAIFLKMAASADVIVENYRPDVKHRLGIDYETIKAFNPRIVYASISGFGQDGPLSKRPGFDQIAQGMGGLMSITGAPGGGPMRVGIPIADLTAGGFAAQGVSAGSDWAGKTDEGYRVQTSLPQAQIAMLDFQATRWLMDSHVPSKPEIITRPQSRPACLKPVTALSISRWLASISGCVSKKRWEIRVWMMSSFATPHSRSDNRDALSDAIADNFRKDTSQNWIERLNKIGVPSGEINTIDKVFTNEQVQRLGIARDMMSTERGVVQIVGQPIIMSNADPSIQRPLPGKGEHTHEILAEYGHSGAEISSYSDKGVI